MSPASKPAPARPTPGVTATPWVAWLLFGLLFQPVLRWLIHIWTHSGYDAHGALVPFVAAGMIWSRKPALQRAPHAPKPAGLLLAGAGLLLLLASQLTNFNLLGGLALVVAAAGMVWTLWGDAVARLLSFPLAFLLLMLPINYPLEILLGFPLRMLSTRLSAMLLGWLGVATTIHGTIITTARFAVSIESPCSGLKTLSALLLAGLMVAFFLHKRVWHRVLILLLIAPVALAANALRNTTIILIGHNYGEAAAMGWLHAFSGLAVFLLSLLLLVLISEILLWRRKPASS